MNSESHDQEQLEYRLGELMTQTDHLATPRILECESCGSRVIVRDEGEPCPQCAIRS
jgi:rubrerythrin